MEQTLPIAEISLVNSDKPDSIAGPFEGMTDDQWSEHLEFITDCIEKGVKPTHFIDVLIEAQQSFNSLFNEQVDEEDE